MNVDWLLYLFAAVMLILNGAGVSWARWQYAGAAMVFSLMI